MAEDSGQTRLKRCHMRRYLPYLHVSASQGKSLCNFASKTCAIIEGERP
nr:MAG TPA: hypothetical protein [Caudoviricetes sp.]